MAKISGPLLDRIDLRIEVPAVKYKELSSKEMGECSMKIRSRVMQARDIQVHRFKGRKGLYAAITGRRILRQTLWDHLTEGTA